VKRSNSQEKIRAVFEPARDAEGAESGSNPKFDFSRPDHISKPQIRAIHTLHEGFVRRLVSDLSAYLRTYTVMNLISVEQTSYSDFLECLPPSTFVACLGMHPFEGAAVLELNPSLVFAILELLLGGSGKSQPSLRREITEIERNLMDGTLRLILRNLSEAWKTVAAIDFSVQSIDTEPQTLQIMAPSEAVVSVGIEIRVGEASGLMNIAMPSVMIKMMRHRFDQQWSLRKTAATEDEEDRVLRLLGPSLVDIEARIEGGTIKLEDLLHLDEGQILVLDHPLEKMIQCNLNGQKQFAATVLQAGRRCAVRVVKESAG
jgi:flagellar motor switch protein FliM